MYRDDGWWIGLVSQITNSSSNAGQVWKNSLDMSNTEHVTVFHFHSIYVTIGLRFWNVDRTYPNLLCMIALASCRGEQMPPSKTRFWVARKIPWKYGRAVKRVCWHISNTYSGLHYTIIMTALSCGKLPVRSDLNENFSRDLFLDKEELIEFRKSSAWIRIQEFLQGFFNIARWHFLILFISLEILIPCSWKSQQRIGPDSDGIRQGAEVFAVRMLLFAVDFH